MFSLVYEINTRIWLQKLSVEHNYSVTLGTVPDEEFSFISSCKFDIVWLMGVWTPSQYSKAIAMAHEGLRSSFLDHLTIITPEKIASSPYSIPSYTVNEALGGEVELLAFREKLHKLGIRLMLDFVPNHLALDNEWLPEYPDYFIPVTNSEHHQQPSSSFEYVKAKYLAYGKDPYFPPWTDTLQLNYARQETHTMMIANLLKISSLCDAVRCDMAMLILKSVFNTTWNNFGISMKNEFWQEAIATVKRLHPNFIFLAESYWNKEWELQQQGFDFTYDKPFYDYLSNSEVDIEKLTGHLLAPWDYQEHLCRFIENHDEPRAAEKLGLNNKAAALISLTSPGMQLIHQGQMEGFRKKIPVQLISPATEPRDLKLTEFYKLLFLLQKSTLFQEGRIEWLNLNTSYASLCLGFRRFTTEANAFILANFSNMSINLSFGHAVLENITIEDLKILSTEFINKTCDITCAEMMIKMILSPHEAVVITFIKKTISKKEPSLQDKPA